MPKLSELRVNPEEATAGRVSDTAQATPAISEPPAELTRSAVMLASLPGLGSGPDAVVRQFGGGRNVPKGRILVP